MLTVTNAPVVFEDSEKDDAYDKIDHFLRASLDDADYAEYSAALELISAAWKDSERLDFIEQRTRKSQTGVSFDWVPSVEGDPSGYRMMWRHTINDQKKTIRAAIDEAMSKTPNG